MRLNLNITVNKTIMSNNKPWVNFLLLLVTIYLSSIVQLLLLYFFPILISIKRSSEFVTIGNLWILGIIFDLASIVMWTLPSLFLKKRMSPLPIGLVFYLISHLLYGFPRLFLNYQQLQIPIQSLVKVFEFMIFMSFHTLCISILPGWVDRYLRNLERKP